MYSGTYVCNFTGTGGTELVHGVSLCRQCSREGTHHRMEHVVPNTGKRAWRGPRTLAISPNPASEKDKRAGGQQNQAESSSPRALPNTLLSLFYFPPPLLHPHHLSPWPDVLPAPVSPLALVERRECLLHVLYGSDILIFLQPEGGCQEGCCSGSG